MRSDDLGRCNLLVMLQNGCAANARPSRFSARYLRAHDPADNYRGIRYPHRDSSYRCDRDHKTNPEIHPMVVHRITWCAHVATAVPVAYDDASCPGATDGDATRYNSDISDESPPASDERSPSRRLFR